MPTYEDTIEYEQALITVIGWLAKLIRIGCEPRETLRTIKILVHQLWNVQQGCDTEVATKCDQMINWLDAAEKVEGTIKMDNWPGYLQHFRDD